MFDNIGEVIAKNRKAKHISQVELATRLGNYGIQISNAAISAWEKGINTPTAAQFLAICKILEISDIYTEFIGINPLDPFLGLNPEGIAKANEYIDLLKTSGKYKEEPAKILHMEPRFMKISLLPSSAGTGNYLDDENFETVEVYEPVPKDADFGVYLDGNSMEPRFMDKSLVWIHKTDELESGDIGLFYLDGKTYFKKLVVKSSGTFLISLNAKYPPIPVTEFSSFKIFGKIAELS